MNAARWLWPMTVLFGVVSAVFGMRMCGLERRVAEASTQKAIDDAKCAAAQLEASARERALREALAAVQSSVVPCAGKGKP